MDHRLVAVRRRRQSGARHDPAADDESDDKTGAEPFATLQTQIVAQQNQRERRSGHRPEMIAKVRGDADREEADFQDQCRRDKGQSETARWVVAATPRRWEEHYGNDCPKDGPSKRRGRFCGCDVLPGPSDWALW